MSRGPAASEMIRRRYCEGSVLRRRESTRDLPCFLPHTLARTQMFDRIEQRGRACRSESGESRWVRSAPGRWVRSARADWVRSVRGRWIRSALGFWLRSAPGIGFVPHPRLGFDPHPIGTARDGRRCRGWGLWWGARWLRSLGSDAASGCRFVTGDAWRKSRHWPGLRIAFLLISSWRWGPKPGFLAGVRFFETFHTRPRCIRASIPIPVPGFRRFGAISGERRFEVARRI